MIPAEAVEAAARVYRREFPYDENEGYVVKLILEAAAPHMLADYLLTLAADVRARGDIGKDDGLESWDYLAWKAEQLRTAK